MPGGPVTARGTGLVGKLPAHGDFVRRGDDPALLARFDRWLDVEIGRAMAGASDERLATMPAWRFVLPEENGAVLGALVASRDTVGRAFPLLGFVHVASAPAVDDAERCCAAAEAVILAASRGERDVVATLAALGALSCDPGGGTAPAAGRWWREGDAIAGDTWPSGASFDRLLGPQSADALKGRP
jgi:type VI secretion system protein ImpM